ncbi:MAG: reverse transcriptase domain-containing protein [Asticcacaulis sp.]
MPKLGKPQAPYKRLCSEVLLHNAWQVIYQNGLRSTSNKTRESVRIFKERERQNISRIYRAILNRKFKFEGVHGVAIGDKKRPIALSSVEGRVVQRAILDVLQDQAGITKYLNAPGSYGALKSEYDSKKGVRPAIEAAVRAIEMGADSFFQSDIKSFFTSIPRPEVIKTIGKSVDDTEFLDILEKATNLEVQNIDRIPKDQRQFFDYTTVGTPQGCCLSPLIGNILLYDFDVQMNGSGVTCLRYLDDFIILGKGWKAVHDASERAIQILSGLGLSAYNLNELNTKAVSGQIANGFDFLGVEVFGQNIRPNKKSRLRLLETVQDMMTETFKQNFEDIQSREQRDHSLIATLYAIDNKIRGWGNQYSFCNEGAIWGNVDEEINKIIKGYLGRYGSLREAMESKKARRRLLGVHLVSESKSDPIMWSSQK